MTRDSAGLRFRLPHETRKSGVFEASSGEIQNFCPTSPSSVRVPQTGFTKTPCFFLFLCFNWNNMPQGTSNLVLFSANTKTAITYKWRHRYNLMSAMERIYSRVDHAHLAHDHFLRGHASGVEVHHRLRGDAGEGLCGGQIGAAAQNTQLGVLAGSLTRPRFLGLHIKLKQVSQVRRGWNLPRRPDSVLYWPRSVSGARKSSPGGQLFLANCRNFVCDKIFNSF